MEISKAAFTCLRVRRLLLWAATLSMISLHGVEAQRPGRHGDVTTRGGVVYSGNISFSNRVTKVASPLTDVYLTTSATKGTEYNSATEQMTIYKFNEHVHGLRKKGQIDPLIKNFRMTVAADGTASISLLDPKLGQVNFTAALTKLTPYSIHWSGVEYSHEFSFPLNNYPHLMRLVTATIDKSKPDSVLRASRFMRQAGNLIDAGRTLNQLPKGNAARKAELQAIERAKNLAQLEDIRLLEHRGAIAAAAQRINDKVKAVASDDERAWLDALSQTGKILATAPRPDLSNRARLRLAELGKLNKQSMASLKKDEITSLSQRWSATMADQVWTPETFRESISLSQSVATFMRSDSDKGLLELARQLESSKLPRSILLDVVRYAPMPIPTKRQWHRVDYVEPVSRKSFYYYASIPANAGPLDQLPVLVCLHGMNSKADVMYRFWGRWAERHGYVIVSPEYIYGRNFGFEYSEEEVHAVNGAITHALRTLPIDSSKVFLQGHSQGGHAAWEIGAALSGRLTGVIPMLSASVHTSYLSNFRHTAIYTIDGSKDGAAPIYNRKAISNLASHGVDAIYVEYRDRAHEAFYEEYDRVFAWARPRARDYVDKVELRASRKSDYRRRWIRIESSKKPLPAKNGRALPFASVQAEKRGESIVIRTSNVSRLSVLTPVEWLDAKRKLRVTVNGRTLATFTPSLDWKFLLREAQQTGDRTFLYCGETTVNPR